MPIIADLVTFAMMLYEHSLAKTDTDPYFIILTLAYLLQGALCLLMLVRIYTRAEEKSKVVRENYEAIKEFTHSLYIWLKSARQRKEFGVGSAQV